MIYTPYSSRRMGGIIIQVFRSSQTDGSGRPVLTKGKRPLIQHVVLDNKKWPYSIHLCCFSNWSLWPWDCAALRMLYNMSCQAIWELVICEFVWYRSSWRNEMNYIDILRDYSTSFTMYEICQLSDNVYERFWSREKERTIYCWMRTLSSLHVVLQRTEKKWTKMCAAPVAQFFFLF